MKVLDLFSGIGGFSLGLHRAGMQTVAFCEIEDFCAKVLNKNFPGIPIFNDIRKLNKESLHEIGIGSIDVVCGGFPCQPFSNAGKKKGREDDRDLWPEMFRVIKETNPTWVIGENVAGFIGMEFTRTKVDLESIGYSVQPFVIPACAVGAQHRRDRVWIIAYLDRSKLRIESGRSCGASREDPAITGYNGEERFTSNIESIGNRGGCSEVFREGKESISEKQGEEFECCDEITRGEKPSSDINSDGLSRKTNANKKKNSKQNWESDWRSKAAADFGYWWADKSGVGRAVYGFSTRVDRYRRPRVKSLGNAVVPQIPELIGRAILEVKNGEI